MLLKNLVVYRLTKKRIVKAEDLEAKLASQALQPCSGLAMESRGWLSPRDDDRYLYSQSHHWLLTLGLEQKILPTSVVRQAAKEQAAQISAKQGRPVGRKEMRDLRERITTELLPRALARRTTTRAWVDVKGGWLAIDASADKKAEEFLEALRRAEDDFPCRRLETQRSAGGAMTSWLGTQAPPPGFTIDQDLELQSQDMSKATIRYAHHSLEGKDIRDHIKYGKSAIRLGMTWKDKISFILTDQLHVKRINFVNVIREDSEDETIDKEEQFDLDFALMTGELSQFLDDLVEALGGEKSA